MQPIVTTARQGGVGLVEVLVAIVILSIGFLAVAQMQIQGMRFSQSAYFTSQASMMLKDMTDRMRSNREGVLAGAYDSMATNASTSAPACIASDLPCSPVELAQRDVHEWSANLYAPTGTANFSPVLPSGGGNVAGGSVTANAGVYDIVVQWNERIDGSDTLRQLAVQFIP